MDIFVPSCIQGWLYFPMTLLLVSIEHVSDHLPINTTSRHSIERSSPSPPPACATCAPACAQSPDAGLHLLHLPSVRRPPCSPSSDCGCWPAQHHPQASGSRQLSPSPGRCPLRVRRRNLKLAYTHASIHTNIFTHMHTYIYVCICIHTSIKHMEVKRNGGS